MKLSIDDMIRVQFGLFGGKRPMAEDKAIFETVLTGVMDEVWRFVDDTLGSVRRGRILAELAAVNKDMHATENEVGERLGRAIWKEVASTPELVAQLKARIGYYLNRLAYDARTI